MNWLRCLIAGHKFGPTLAQDSYDGDITVECVRCGTRWTANSYVIDAYERRYK